jgi:sulfonate transport system substrate-binding protein
MMRTLLILALLLVCRVAAADPVPIRVGWIVVPNSLLPLMPLAPGAAVHLGKTYTLEPKYYRGTNLEITAMAAGELDVGDLGFSTIPIAIQAARMSNLRIFADETIDGWPGWTSTAFMVRKDSGIKTVADLKGKVLATNAIGGGVYVAMVAVLDKAGLHEKRDYTVIEVPFPSMTPILLDKKADLVTESHPFLDNPALQAQADVLFRSVDGLGPNILASWAAPAPWLQKNRAALVDMVEDYLRAMAWYMNPANRQQAIQIISTFTKQPPANFEPWLFSHDDYYRPPTAVPDSKVMQANIDAQVKLGMLKSSLNIADYTDPTLAQEAATRVAK